MKLDVGVFVGLHWRRKLEVLGQNATLTTTNPIRNFLGLNTGICGGRPTAKRPSPWHCLQLFQRDLSFPSSGRLITTG